MQEPRLTEAERSAILDEEIKRWVANDYRLQTRTATTAQLVRPKTFSVALAVMWLLCLVVGLLIYLLIYLAQSDETVYLVVEEDGTISGSGTGIRQRRAAGATDWVCDQCGRANNEFRSLCKRCRAPRR